jgi:ankyrin repeat protein
MQGDFMFAKNTSILGAIRGLLAITLALVLVSIVLPNTVRASDKNQELITTAGEGDLKRVTKLLEDGADVNAKDKSRKTTLIDAAWGGNQEVVGLLLGKGADVNATTKSGESALKVAYGEEVKELLLEHGAKKSQPSVSRDAASPQALQKKQDTPLPRNQ